MATRLYFPANNDLPGLSPTSNAGWDAGPHNRRRMSTIPVGDAMASITDVFNAGTGVAAARMVRMYVSAPMIAGQTINPQNIKAQIRASEGNAIDNMSLSFSVEIKGFNSTHKKTMLSVTSGPTELATTLVNRVVSGTSASGSYATVSGDRLVVCIGVAGTQGGGTVNLTFRLGTSAASDLPQDESSTSDLRPWVEFADTILFNDPPSITADTGSYTLDGQDATLTKENLLIADAGAYLLDGQDAEFFPGKALEADVGDYLFDGQAAELLATRSMTVGAGEYLLSGQDADFVIGSLGASDAGEYLLAGQDADLLATRLLTVDAGEYILNGQQADLIYSGEAIVTGNGTQSNSLVWLLIDEQGGTR